MFKIVMGGLAAFGVILILVGNSLVAHLYYEWGEPCIVGGTLLLIVTIFVYCLLSGGSETRSSKE